jgi:hypothetical protein
MMVAIMPEPLQGRVSFVAIEVVIPVIVLIFASALGLQFLGWL